MEYCPPISGHRFAILHLVFPRPVEKWRVAELMELELDYWLTRYAVPIMVSAFDDRGSLIHLAPIRNCDYLTGFSRDDGKGVYCIWKPVPHEELPYHGLDTEYLKRVYVDIPFKTGEQLRRDSEKKNRELKIGWLILFIWLVIVPAIVVILGFANRWIGVLVLLYSLWQAIVKALKLAGKWKPSRREIEREEEERRMRHHHYHCERNPEGFRRLMLENFKKDEKEAIQNEAKMLKRKHTSTK